MIHIIYADIICTHINKNKTFRILPDSQNIHLPKITLNPPLFDYVEWALSKESLILWQEHSYLLFSNINYMKKDKFFFNWAWSRMFYVDAYAWASLRRSSGCTASTESVCKLSSNLLSFGKSNECFFIILSLDCDCQLWTRKGAISVYHSHGNSTIFCKNVVKI